MAREPVSSQPPAWGATPTPDPHTQPPHHPNNYYNNPPTHHRHPYSSSTCAILGYKYSSFSSILMGFWLILALFTLTVSGDQCGPCEPQKCVLPATCAGSLVPDSCDCCLVCARQVGESCGGRYGMSGRCEPGLQCLVNPESGEPVHADMDGTCTAVAPLPPESLCDKSKCVETGHVLPCPNDTTLVYDMPAPGGCCPPASSCQCLPCQDSRDLLQCGVTEVKVLVQGRTGIPGYCCDVYACRDREEVCGNVTCPHEETTVSPCPSDSEPLPPLVSHGGCCTQHTGCKCKDKRSCDDLTCPSGHRVQVVLPSLNEPGNCCDRLKCVNDSCTYEGTEYADGETWSPKHCTTCSCRSSLVFCSSMKCDNLPPSNCGWLGLEDETQCCPVCKGCISSNGSRYANGETWERDECTTCRCEEGVSSCQAHMCVIDCAHPRKDPTRCCPVCDDILIVTQAPHCVPPENCTIQCILGWKKDEQGCYTCECNPGPEEICGLTCPAGLRHDVYGQPLCECEMPVFTTHQPPCPPLRRCKKNCAHGYKKNKYGCDRCRCKKCPPFNCKKKCAHGYAYSNEGNASNQGCKICRCKDPAPSLPPVDVTNLPPGTSSCMSIDGRLMEDGESWYDGCRRCFCHDGFEWCSLITCPVLPCRHPVIRPADCCPSCPEDNPTSLVPGAPTRCQASGGTYRAEGETWQLDSCTKCICHAGGVLCQIESCPPLLCHHPIQLRGVCCPSCPDDGSDIFQYQPVQTPRTCTTVTGTRFDDGDSWRANACQSCMCQMGQVHCFSQTCPLLTCNYTLLKKGQCCPFCVAEHAVSSCHHGGETYVTGEGWLIENCRQCMCDHGHVVCSKLECPPPRCRFPTKVPGICCPICSNGTLEVTAPPDGGLPPALPPNRTKAPPPDTQQVDDVPHEEGRYRTFGITVGILATIVVILILLIVILLILLRRTRRKSGISLAGSSKVTEVMMPKSTNVELQGLPPITNGHGPLCHGLVSNGHGPLSNGHGPLTNGNLYKNQESSEKCPTPVMNVILREEKEKENNLKTSPDDLKSFRYSSAEGALKHELVIPTNPNDFRKSV